jgi:hypothetical protein
VILATTYSLFEVIHNSNTSKFFRVADFIVSIIFISELVLRIYCSAIVNKGLVVFLSSSLNVLDVVVVLLDVILLSIGTQTGQAVSFAKYAPLPIPSSSPHPVPARSIPALFLSFAPLFPPLELFEFYDSFESFVLPVS